MSTPPLPPELRARILAAVDGESVPTRAVRTRRAVLGLAVGFGALLLALVAHGIRTHGRPVGYMAALAASWLPIAAAATWAGVARGRSMLGRPLSWLYAVVAVTPLAMFATWAIVALFWPSTFHDASGPKQHLICDTATIFLSIGPLLALGAYRRGTALLTPRLAGAAIGTAAAAWAAIVLHLFCGFTRPFHILVGHILPVVLVAWVGSILTARTVAIRTKTG
jgi:hypothetical protein